MPRKTSFFIGLSIIPLYIIVKLLRLSPSTIESLYSLGIYKYISSTLRYTFGWLPFSFGDIFYTISIVYILRWLFKNFRRFLKTPIAWFTDILSAISLIYLAFHLFWAFNYYRKPLHENLNLKADYSTEELITVTQKLIKKSNQLHDQLAKSDSIKVIFPFDKNTVLKETPNNYKLLAKQFPHLEYSPVSLKKSLLSYPLTIMGFSGYLNPLTNEAQVNSYIPIYKFPTTCSHEVAHQLGYAAENEANFIGCLATITSPNPYYKYSGYTFALRFCLSEVYKRNPNKYYEIAQTINPGIYKNYQEVRVFWDNYKNITEPVFKETYNTYLKANNQDKGIESYSYVVALFVNYFYNQKL